MPRGRRRVRDMPRRQQRAVFAELSGWDEAPGGMKSRTRGGKPQRRRVGRRNLTDKSAARLGRSRKKYHYSSTDHGPRGHPIRRGGVLDDIF